MGLSDQERFKKLTYSVSKISQLGRELKSEYNEYARLKDLCSKLWAAFLGNSANRMFWIVGGGFTERYFSESSLLGLAFQEQKHTGPDDEISEEREDWEFYSNYIKVDNIIDDQPRRQIIIIYQWVENLLYALHRYDDEFSKRDSLNQVVRDIQGELFDIIRGDDMFYRAWLLSNILEVCVRVYQDDIIYEWIKQQAVHHDFRLCREHSKEDLQATWFYLQPLKYNEITIEKRLFILMAIAGRRFHYDHNWKRLKKLIEKHNQEQESKISVEGAEEIFKWGQEQKKQYDEGQKDRYRPYCELSQQEV